MSVASEMTGDAEKDVASAGEVETSRNVTSSSARGCGSGGVEPVEIWKAASWRDSDRLKESTPFI